MLQTMREASEMRQILRGRVRAVLVGAAVTALALAGPGSPADAQTFNDAITGALSNQCDGLRGPKQGNLATICSSIPVGPGTSGGSSIASQTMRQQDLDQRRI